MDNNIKKYSAQTICQLYGFQRDAYYKYKNRQTHKELEETKIMELVRARKVELPREGCKKMLTYLTPLFENLDIKIGRDKMFKLLKDNDLLVHKKHSFVKTTDSNHPFYKYLNIVQGTEITGINQVWVSDITYIRLIKGHCYLALITDAYSRKIVGYDISDTLELTGCMRALNMALKTLPKGHSLIHHSDRGSQYCSNAYTDLLKKHTIKISMTQEDHCYENAMAERVNGILKDEFYLDSCFTDLSMASIASRNAISLYNNKRLHMSLNYLTPNQVYEAVNQGKNKILEQIKNYYFYQIKQNVNEQCWRATRQG